MLSVLWRCWLGGRKGIRPVKNFSGEVMTWLSVWSKVQTYLSEARCRLFAYGPLPLMVSCFSKIKINFTFLVLAHPGSPGKRAVEGVCVCVCRSELQPEQLINQNCRVWLTEASISTRILGQDLTISELCWLQQSNPTTFRQSEDVANKCIFQAKYHHLSLNANWTSW